MWIDPRGAESVLFARVGPRGRLPPSFEFVEGLPRTHPGGPFFFPIEE